MACVTCLHASANDECRDERVKISGRKLFVTVASAMCVILALVIAGRWHRRQSGVAVDQPRKVGVVPVGVKDVPVYVEAPGTVTPMQTVVVHTQVSGTLTAIRFHEGQHVKAGDILATIDDRAFKAQVMAATGTLQRDQALLDNAHADLERDRALVKIGSVTRQQLDTQAALVKQYEGAVKADTGSLGNLQVQLGYTRVLAPIDGVAGLRAVDAGNLVQPTDANGIVTLTSLAPTSVKFAVPEDDLSRVLAAEQESRSGQPLSVDAFDRSSHTVLARGWLDAIDSLIDVSTGTVMMRAIFDDPGHRLFPNQFVNVRLQLYTLHQVEVVPTRAIQHGTRGDYVYIEQAGKAVRKTIVAGPTAGDDTVVLDQARGTSPLPSKAVVISDGADALDDGVAVSLSESANATGGTR